MSGIHENDFIKLVRGILSNPVRVKNSEATAYLPTDTFLRNTSQTAGRFLLTNTLVLRLPVYDSLRYTFLSVTASNSDPVDDIALLCLVAESAGFIRSSWMVATMDSG